MSSRVYDTWEKKKFCIFRRNFHNYHLLCAQQMLRNDEFITIVGKFSIIFE